MIGLVGAALPAAAQDTAEPLTWVLSVTVKPGKLEDLEKAAQKYDKPVFEKLLADGSISSYGLACQMVGPPAESCLYWATAADWSGMGKVEKAFEDGRKGMKETEVKEMMDAFLGATVPEKETSFVVRHVVFNGAPGRSPNYLVRHVYNVSPGKGRAAVNMYKEYNAPVYEKLLASGVIDGYGVAVPDFHVGAAWTHTMWTMFSDLSQMDATDKAFEDADEARGEAVNEALDASWMQMHDRDAHWDSLMRISMYGGQ
jgi:hypothetical protein